MAVPGLPRYVRLARLGGVAPYRRTPAGGLRAPRALQALSAALLAANAASAVVTDVLIPAPGLHLHQQTHYVGQYSDVICKTLFALWLHFRQSRALRDLLNEPAVQRGFSSRSRASSAVPYAIVLVHFGGAFIALLLRWAALSSAFPPLTTLLQWISWQYWMFAKSSNLGLFTFVLGCVFCNIDEIQNDLSYVVEHRFSTTLDEISEMRLVFKEAYVLTSKTCSCFALSIILYLYQDLWWLIESIFGSLTADADRKTFYSVLECILDETKSIVTLAILLVYCQDLNRKTDAILFLIHSLRDTQKPFAPQVREIEHFAHEVFQQPLVVCIWDLIRLDLKLLSQCAALAASYVIILIQLQGQGQCGGGAQLQPRALNGTH